MKLLSLLFLLGLYPLLCFSQYDHTSSNIERYNLDYELLDHAFLNGDSSILNVLNIEGMLLSRKINHDVEITDLEHGVRILIYSEARAKKERNTPRIKVSTYKNTTE